MLNFVKMQVKELDLDVRFVQGKLAYVKYGRKYGTIPLNMCKFPFGINPRGKTTKVVMPALNAYNLTHSATEE